MFKSLLHSFFSVPVNRATKFFSLTPSIFSKTDRINTLIKSTIENTTDEIKMSDEVFEAYEKLLREQLERNERIKAQKEFTDYSKLDKIIILIGADFNVLWVDFVCNICRKHIA